MDLRNDTQSGKQHRPSRCAEDEILDSQEPAPYNATLTPRQELVSLTSRLMCPANPGIRARSEDKCIWQCVSDYTKHSLVHRT